MALVVAGNDPTPEKAEIEAAERYLTTQCMTSKGFTVPNQHLPSRRFEEQISPLFANGGAVASVPPESAAVKAAAESGYGVALRRTEFANQPTGQILTQPSASQPPTRRERAYQAALVGPHGENATFTVAGIAQHTYTTVGCIADASRALYGNRLLAVQTNYLPEDLNLAVVRQLQLDPAYLATTKRWSACVASTTGRHATSPSNAANELLGAETQGSTPVPAETRNTETRLAVADTRCRYSSGLVQTSVALRRKFATQLARPYEGLLLALVEARARARKTAQSVLAAAGR